MKRSILLVVIVWIYIVGTGIVQGFTLPNSPLARNFPFPWPILIAMPLVIVIGAFFKSEVPGEFSIGKRIDQWLGQDTYRTFMKSLKLELLFASMSFGIGIVGVLRTFQLGGPSGAFSICGFFISAGFSFLMAHFIALRRRVYEKSPVAEPNVAVFTASDAAAFWKEAKTRRNLFFATWIGWLLAGPLLVGFYSLILPGASEMTRGTAALATWGPVFIWSGIRTTQLRCFRCGKQAFSGPMFFMKHAKCRNCGVTPKNL